MTQQAAGVRASGEHGERGEDADLCAPAEQPPGASCPETSAVRPRAAAHDESDPARKRGGQQSGSGQGRLGGRVRASCRGREHDGGAGQAGGGHYLGTEERRDGYRQQASGYRGRLSRSPALKDWYARRLRSFATADAAKTQAARLSMATENSLTAVPFCCDAHGWLWRRAVREARGLEREQPRVGAGTCHQGLVVALFCDRAVDKNHDVVGVPDRVQPVGDQHRCAAVTMRTQPAVYLVLRLGVQARARLIEDHQVPAAAQEGPGQRDALPLSAGQQYAGARILLVGQIDIGAGEQRVVGLGQRGEGAVDACPPGTAAANASGCCTRLRSPSAMFSLALSS